MPSGRMLGGSDGFSNMIYARGNPQDYDVWASMGATGWSYEDVLPYFIKSENNKNSFFKTSREFAWLFVIIALPTYLWSLLLVRLTKREITREKLSEDFVSFLHCHWSHVTGENLFCH